MSSTTELHGIPLPGKMSRDANAIQLRHALYAAQRPALTRKISVSARPKTSSGIAPRQSLAALRPLVTDTPQSRFGDVVPDFGTTIDFQSGLETFKFPTPSPHLPPRSATFPEALSPRQTESTHIGLAIGSPSELFCRDDAIEPLHQSIIRHPPRMSSLPPADPFHFVPPGRIDNEDSAARQRKPSWRGIGSMFRKSSKTTVPTLGGPMNPQDARKDSLLSSPEQLPLDEEDEEEEKVTALPQLHHSPRPMSRGRAHSHIVMQSKLGAGLRSGRLGATPSRSSSSSQNSAPPVEALTYLPPARTSEFAPIVKRQDSPMADDSCSSYTTGSTTSLSSVEPAPEQRPATTRSSLWERRKSRLQSLAENDASRRINTQARDISPPKTTIRQRRITSPTVPCMPAVAVHTEEIPIINATGFVPRSSTAAAQFRRPMSSPITLVSPMNAHLTRRQPITPSDIERSFLLNESPVASPALPHSPKHRRDFSDPHTEMPSPKAIRVSLDTFASRHQSLASPVDLDQHILEISVAKRVTVTTAWARGPQTLDVKQPLRARVIELGKGRKGSAATIS